MKIKPPILFGGFFLTMRAGWAIMYRVIKTNKGGELC